MNWKLLPVLAVVLTLAACGDDDPSGPSTPAIPTATGQWTGTASGISFSFTLSEASNGSITGSGSASAPTGSIAMTVRSGTHAHPNISLTLGGEGFEDANFQGAFAGDNTITGSINGSGFNNFALTLQRQ